MSVFKYLHARKLKKAIANHENAKRRVEILERLDNYLKNLDSDSEIEISDKVVEKLEKIKNITELEEFVDKIIESISVKR